MRSLLLLFGCMGCQIDPAAEIELGRHLFYERGLSADGETSCATCHIQALAFTDGRALPVGAHGTLGHRNSMSVANTASFRTLTWANPALGSLEEQAQVPLFSEDPIELDISGVDIEALGRTGAYPSLVRRMGLDALSVAELPSALAAFVSTIESRNSPWDRQQRGQQAMSDAALRGERSFHQLGCVSCHPPPLFTTAATDADPFANTGLYDLGDGVYPRHGEGLFSVTGRPEDMGRFRPPSLREVHETAPYMHDGSAPDLQTVLRDYARGGRLTTVGPHAGDGSNNPHKDPRIQPFTLTDERMADLIAFLRSLSDPALRTEAAWSDPSNP